MRRYPNYKESGATWLERIPAHWGLSYLKYQTRFTNGSPFKPGDWSGKGTPIIRIENLNGSEEFNRFFGEVEEKYHVREGDLLFAWSGNIGTSFGPYIWNRPGLHYLNQHIFKLSSFHFDKHYFYWLLRGVTSYVESQTTGIIGLVHVTKQELGRIPIPRIPSPEQEVIARYLDSKASEIARFIANKKKLIALLHEQKIAFIRTMVLRGQAHGRKRKRSGLDWLGDIPAHWQVKRNGALFGQRVERGTPDLPILAVSLHSGVTTDEESDEADRPKRTIEDRTSYKKTLKGDLAYNTMRMWQGAVGVVPTDGLVSPAYVVARAYPGVHSGYYAYLFRTDAYKTEINRNSRGIVSDRNRLYWDDFKQLQSPYPPFEEQRQMVEAIERECGRVDQAIAKARREIDLIKEYRTTLISDAVTGKIDVRGEV